MGSCVLKGITTALLVTGLTLLAGILWSTMGLEGLSVSNLVDIGLLASCLAGGYRTARESGLWMLGGVSGAGYVAVGTLLLAWFLPIRGLGFIQVLAEGIIISSAAGAIGAGAYKGRPRKGRRRRGSYPSYQEPSYQEYVFKAEEEDQERQFPWETEGKSAGDKPWATENEAEEDQAEEEQADSAQSQWPENFEYQAEQPLKQEDRNGEWSWDKDAALGGSRESTVSPVGPVSPGLTKEEKAKPWWEE